MLKKQLRLQFQQLSSSKTTAEIEKESEVIAKEAITLIKNSNFKVIGIYISNPREVGTTAIINYCFQQNILVACPRINEDFTMTFYQILNLENEIEKHHKFSVNQPKKITEVPLSTIEVFFVPLVAFDNLNNRLGRGKGYYDRLLSSISDKVLKVGLGFSWQQSKNQLPISVNDVRLDQIIIPKLT
ncbi:5-formyltetrahydrofolate cyclo-ligase [Spiroplasma sabaudiense Ar-1343]|uniref:5-formyltetrahydrofolate cyclo-ligase n=1 Tax=Spiroplasma sabaudiense Ar-1343 TaxID=1276257 RepID=W6AAZ5_9MOLU|nr:5-formyltetrahydrofolate cyclo-ligase [Spiroplasma sabaudiense]AHI54030.1 5-formyltetrahydrofolate cyclo-ligase [Spiroplasma sabaudiense Ar-1343]